MSKEARALLDQAVALRQAGDSVSALERAQRALSLLPDTDIGAGRLRGQIQLVLGNALADCGRFDEADVALQGAGEAFMADGHNAEFAQAQISRGRVLAERGDTALAIQFFSELEAMALPDLLMSQVLNNLGLLNRRIGNLGDAIHYLTKDAELCANMRDNYGAAVAEYNLAGALAAAGRPQEAVRRAKAAADQFRASGRDDLQRQAVDFASSLASG